MAQPERSRSQKLARATHDECGRSLARWAEPPTPEWIELACQIVLWLEWIRDHPDEPRPPCPSYDTIQDNADGASAATAVDSEQGNASQDRPAKASTADSVPHGAESTATTDSNVSYGVNERVPAPGNETLRLQGEGAWIPPD